MVESRVKIMSSNIHDSSWRDKEFNEKEQIIATEIKSKKKKRWFEFETKPVWCNIIVITTLHIFSLYSIVTFPYLNHKILFLWSKYSILNQLYNLFN